MHQLRINVNLNYDVPKPMDILLQMEVADGYAQTVENSNLVFNEQTDVSRIAGQENIGRRTWFNKSGNMVLEYDALVSIDRASMEIASLEAVPTRLLDAEATHYLMPSTYCPAFEFVAFVEKQFPGLSGGRFVNAVVDWMRHRFDYVIGSSNHRTTATDTFVQRQGVCRDYVHVLICMCRAAAIPARFASVYAPDVKPQDFHAVAEVFLDGYWHLIDPTGMSSPDKMGLIGVGSDAAEVAFMTSFGLVSFVHQTVDVKLANEQDAARIS